MDNSQTRRLVLKSVLLFKCYHNLFPLLHIGGLNCYPPENSVSSKCYEELNSVFRLCKHYKVRNGGADAQTVHKLQAACISCSVITVIRSVKFASVEWWMWAADCLEQPLISQGAQNTPYLVKGSQGLCGIGRSQAYKWSFRGELGLW